MLLYDLILSNEPADSKVAYFYVSVRVHQNVIEFDVSVENAAAVAVCNTVHYLYKNVFGHHFFEVLIALD